MNGFDTLGCHEPLASEIGDILSSLLQAGASVAQGAIEEHQAGEVESKKTATEHAALEEAKAKDAQAAVAIAHAIVSQATGAKSATSDGSFAQKILAEATAARAKLSPDSEHDRDSAAHSQLDQARARSSAAPKDGYKDALAKAWEKVASGTGGAPTKKSSESWLTRRVIGPVPGYGVLVGGGGILAGAGLLLKHFLRR